MPTVDPARHDVRVLGTCSCARSLRHNRSAVSAIPHRAGNSSITVSTTAPPSAYSPGTMCERMHAASTNAAQTRCRPSRTAAANSPRNRTDRARLNEKAYSPASVENRLPP